MAANRIVHHHKGNIVAPFFFTPKGLILPSELKVILGLVYKKKANINKNIDTDQIR
jgi:hypothetical protein